MQTCNVFFLINALRQLILPVLLLFVVVNLFGQPVLPITKKGERPFIDINKVPASAYSPNRIHIKFLPAYRNNCKQLKANH